MLLLSVFSSCPLILPVEILPELELWFNCRLTATLYPGEGNLHGNFEAVDPLVKCDPFEICWLMLKDCPLSHASLR